MPSRIPEPTTLNKSFETLSLYGVEVFRYLSDLIRVLGYDIRDIYLRLSNLELSTPITVSDTVVPLVASNQHVLVDTSINDVEIELGSAVRVRGKSVYIKRITDDGATTVTLTPNGSETIDEDANYVLSGSGYPSVTLYSDGINWWIFD